MISAKTVLGAWSVLDILFLVMCSRISQTESVISISLVYSLLPNNYVFQNLIADIEIVEFANSEDLEIGRLIEMLI